MMSHLHRGAEMISLAPDPKERAKQSAWLSGILNTDIISARSAKCRVRAQTGKPGVEKFKICSVLLFVSRFKKADSELSKPH